MRYKKSRPEKGRKIFEIIPREKTDPLVNDPFSSKNIIIPVQNVDKEFLKQLGVNEDMLPLNMRSRPVLDVVEDTSTMDPEVFKVLYRDENYEEVTDELIEEANKEIRTPASNNYGYIMSRFLNDLGEGDFEQPVGKPVTTSLGTSCATSRRSRALQEFDERFQRFLDKESQGESCPAHRCKTELGDEEIQELCDDLNKLTNGREYVPQFEGHSWGGESDASTIHEESDECPSVRRAASRCMFSENGSQFDNVSLGTSSSVQPRLVVHSSGRKKKPSVCRETVVELMPELPKPDFSQIDRKTWKTMVKEDRRIKRQRKKETKIMFNDSKLKTHQLMVDQPKKHLGIL